MLNRLLFFLLFCTSLLQAQDAGHWQTYMYPGGLVNGAETNGQLWLANSAYILQIDKNTGEEQLHYFAESEQVNYIQDIKATGPDEVTVINWRNRLQRWRNGQWTEQQLELINSNHFLNSIVGQDRAGRLLLASGNDLYALDDNNELEWLHINTQIDYGIAIAKIDQQYRTWVSTNYGLMCFAENGTLLHDFPLGNPQPTDLEFDPSGNVWLATSQGLYFWDNTAEVIIWHANLAGNNTLYPDSSLPNGMRLFNYGEWMQLTYEGEGIINQELTPPDFAEPVFYNSRPFFDTEGNFWFVDHLLRFWKWSIAEGPTPKKAVISSWIPVPQPTEIAIDQQGKVWMGGANSLAYLMGGRWTHLPLTTTDFSLEQVNSIEFNPDGNPIVGVSTLQFFGFPEQAVREWNGTSWDTLHEAVPLENFASNIELELNRNDNLWLVLPFDDEFSVRYQGQWFRYATTDVQAAGIDFFVCLQEGPDGSMWIGTNNGLLNFDGFQFKHISAEDMGIEHFGILDIDFDEEGRMWLAAGRAGIIRQEGDSWVQEALPFGTNQDLNVQSIAIGPYPEAWAILQIEGVLHYDGEEWEFWNHENTPLFHGRISKVLPDPQGRVWFAHYSGAQVYAPEKLPIQSFTRLDANAVQVYPNPGCCQFRLHWEAQEIGSYTVQLHQLDGQLLRQWPIEIDESGETFFEIRDPALPQGTHLISVQHDNSLIGQTLLIVIQ